MSSRGGSSYEFELEKRSRSNATSFSKTYSRCPRANSTSKSVRPRFSVTETRVPSFGSELPVFADLMLLVKFNFSPGCIITSYRFTNSDLFLSTSVHLERATFMPLHLTSQTLHKKLGKCASLR